MAINHDEYLHSTRVSKLCLRGTVSVMTSCRVKTWQANYAEVFFLEKELTLA